MEERYILLIQNLVFAFIVLCLGIYLYIRMDKHFEQFYGLKSFMKREKQKKKEEKLRRKNNEKINTFRKRTKNKQ